jgi:hypothetical protein
MAPENLNLHSVKLLQARFLRLVLHQLFLKTERRSVVLDTRNNFLVYEQLYGHVPLKYVYAAGGMHGSVIRGYNGGKENAIINNGKFLYIRG